jgi:phosphatidylglycerol:prolipoprotein diacylglycerol transferase
MVSVGNVGKPQGRIKPVLRKAAKAAVLALPTMVTGSLYYAGAKVFNLPMIRRTVKSGLPTLYGSAMVSGLWTGYEVSKQNAADNGVDPKKAALAYYSSGLGGVLGAKALYIAQFHDSIPSISEALLHHGGTWYGGALGGLAALGIFAKAAKVPFLKLLDSLSPGAFVGLAIGRFFGCWTGGCCAGEILGLHVEPLSGVFNFGLGLWLNKAAQNFKGKIFLLGTGLYGTFRFAIEFARHEPQVLAGLTLSQIISMLFITTAGVLYAKARKTESAPIEKPKAVQQAPGQKFKQSLAELFAFMPLWYVDKLSTIIITLINLVRTIVTGVKARKSRKNEIM